MLHLPSLFQGSKAQAPRSHLLIFFCYPMVPYAWSLMVIYVWSFMHSPICNLSPSFLQGKQAQAPRSHLLRPFLLLPDGSLWSLMSLMVFFCYLMVPPSCMVLDGPFCTPSHPSSSKPASSKAQASLLVLSPSPAGSPWRPAAVQRGARLPGSSLSRPSSPGAGAAQLPQAPPRRPACPQRPGSGT